MPSKSRSQQRLFCMALAVRKGDLARSKVSKPVLDIVDGDMTNKQIEDFTVLKENNMKHLKDYINESILSSTGSGKQAVVEKWLAEHNIKKSDYEFRNGCLYIQNNSYCVNIKKSIPDYVDIRYIKNVSFNMMDSFDNMPDEMTNCRIFGCEIDDFSFLNKNYALNNFTVDNCGIDSLRGLPECYEKLTISGNDKHYSISDIAKYTKTNPKNIRIFGYKSNTGMNIISTNDKRYIDSQFSEFMKKIKSEIKELRGDIYGKFTINGIYEMTFDFLPLSEQKYHMTRRPFISFTFDTKTNELSLCDYGTNTLRTSTTFIDKCGRINTARIDDFSCELLIKHLTKYLKACAEYLPEYIEKINEYE